MHARRKSFRFGFWLAIFAMMLQLAGCCTDTCVSHNCSADVPHFLPECEELAAKVEYPDVETCSNDAVLTTRPPRSFVDGPPEEYWDLPLQDAIRIGLQNSDILKDLGGRVLDSPQAVRSVFDPSITMSHPRLGEEAALAAFDGQWAQVFTGGSGSQAFNNTTLGGGGTVVDTDSFRIQSQLAKRSATGAQYAIRGLFDYQSSDAPFNLFPSVFNGQWEASVRQPLMQGSGVAFNRIAGPSGNVDISLTRGVVLARIDGDISIAEFERSVRDYVNNVESAYWRLYFAYRNLETNLRARDLARETWQAAKARFDANLRNGEADVEAQAREQLYQFEQQVVVSLNGSVDGTTTGVYQAERQLRRLMGLPMNDGQLIRPGDEPTDAPIRFQWDGCLADALYRRVELRQQMWRVKQRELELFAAKNFLLPRLDAIATYRVSGFGDDILGGGSADFANLGQEFFSFDYDQYEVGLQINVPLGYRRELAGVRHAELNLCRERAILQDQEHQISMDLADAIASLDTTFESLRLAYNRMAAAEQVALSRQAIFEAGKSTIQDLLESQRRLAEAQNNYFLARVSHVRAITQVHFEKGTLLSYNGVYLSEGGWDQRACCEVAYESSRFKHQLTDYRTMTPKVSRGEYAVEMSDTKVTGESIVDRINRTQGYQYIEQAVEPIPMEPTFEEFSPTEEFGTAPLEPIPHPEPYEQFHQFAPGDSATPGPMPANTTQKTAVPRTGPVSGTVRTVSAEAEHLHTPIQIVPDLPPEIPVTSHAMDPASHSVVPRNAKPAEPDASQKDVAKVSPVSAIQDDSDGENSQVSMATFFELTGGQQK